MPFTVYQPTVYGSENSTAGLSAPESKSKDDKEKKGGPELLSKELMNELLKKGLPNEINNFLKQLEKLESGNFGSEFDRNALYSLSAKASKIIYNSKLMDDALKQAYTNDGLEELAVTTTGKIYARNSNGEVKSLSLSEYDKNRNKLQALTVNELSSIRATDDSFIF